MAEYHVLRINSIKTKEEKAFMAQMLEWFEQYQEDYQIKLTKEGDDYRFDVWAIADPYKDICLAGSEDD